MCTVQSNDFSLFYFHWQGKMYVLTPQKDELQDSSTIDPNDV